MNKTDVSDFQELNVSIKNRVESRIPNNPKEFNNVYSGCLSDARKLKVFYDKIGKMTDNKTKLTHTKNCVTSMEQTSQLLVKIAGLGVTKLTKLKLVLPDVTKEQKKYTALASKYNRELDNLSKKIKQVAKVTRKQVADKVDTEDEEKEDESHSSGIEALGLFSYFGKGTRGTIKANLLEHLAGIKKDQLAGKDVLTIDFRNSAILDPHIARADEFLTQRFRDLGGFQKAVMDILLPHKPAIKSFETKIDGDDNPELDKIKLFKSKCLTFARYFFGKLYRNPQENAEFGSELTAKFAVAEEGPIDCLEHNYLFFKENEIHLSGVREFFLDYQTKALNVFSSNFLDKIEHLLPDLQSVMIFLTDKKLEVERNKTGSVAFRGIMRDGAPCYTATLFGNEIIFYPATNERLVKPSPDFNDIKRGLLAYSERTTTVIKNKSLYLLKDECNKTWHDISGVTQSLTSHLSVEEQLHDGSYRVTDGLLTDLYNSDPFSVPAKEELFERVSEPPPKVNFNDDNFYSEIKNKLNQEHIDEVAGAIISLFFKRVRKFGGRSNAGGGAAAEKPKGRKGRGGGMRGGVGFYEMNDVTEDTEFLHYKTFLMHNLQMITAKANSAVNNEYFRSPIGKLAFTIYSFLIRIETIDNKDESFEKRFTVLLAKLMAMEEIAIPTGYDDLLRTNLENLRNIKDSIIDLVQYVFYLPEGEYIARGGRRPQPSEYEKLKKDYESLCSVLDVNKEIIRGLDDDIALVRAELADAKKLLGIVPPAGTGAAVANDEPPVVTGAAVAAPPDLDEAKRKLRTAIRAAKAAKKAARDAKAVARDNILAEATSIAEANPALNGHLTALIHAIKAVDAADDVADAEDAIDAADASQLDLADATKDESEAAEAARVAAEASRVAAEASRGAAEASRGADEAARVADEAARVAAEEARVAAEAREAHHDAVARDAHEVATAKAEAAAAAKVDLDAATADATAAEAAKAEAEAAKAEAEAAAASDGGVGHLSSQVLTDAVKNFKSLLKPYEKTRFQVALEVAAEAAEAASKAAAIVAEADDAYATSLESVGQNAIVARAASAASAEAAASAKAAASAARTEAAEAETAEAAEAAAQGSPSVSVRPKDLDLKILEIASLYTTYETRFKDFCKTLAMFYTVSKDDKDVRNTNPTLANELVALKFPPALEKTSQLYLLCLRYDLKKTYDEFVTKSGNLQKLIMVTRKTYGVSEIIRKARTFMKSRDSLSMTSLINAVQVLTESAQYDSTTDVAVLTARLTDVQDDCDDTIDGFLALEPGNGEEDLLTVKKEKYELLKKLENSTLSISNQQIGTPSSVVPADPRQSPRQAAAPSSPISARRKAAAFVSPQQTSLDVGVAQTPAYRALNSEFKYDVTPLSDMLKRSPLKESPLYGISEALIGCEMTEIGIELAQKQPPSFDTPTDLKEHIKRQKAEVFSRKHVPSEMYKMESAICSEMFELPEAKANFQKNVKIQQVANTDEFYQEVFDANLGVNAVIGKRADLLGSVGQPHARDDVGAALREDVRHLHDKLVRTLDLKDVLDDFEATLSNVTPILETKRVIPEQSKSVSSNVGNFTDELDLAGVRNDDSGVTYRMGSRAARRAARRAATKSPTSPPRATSIATPTSPNAAHTTELGGGARETSNGSLLKTDTDSAIKPIQDANPAELSTESLEKVDANLLYDLYIYFLENGIEEGTREKIKTILYYHGIYCPPEPQKAIDLKELVEQVKQSYAEDDYKCEKCCHTVFGMGFHQLFYSLSSGSPAIPFGCHPYLLDDPMNRNTFLYIFGVSRYLHVAFPRSARMELYFMTLCSAFGRDYWICKRPNYDIEVDMIHPLFFTTFYELSGEPEYYEVNLTPEEFLESNGEKFAKKIRGEMVEVMDSIKSRQEVIEAEVRKKLFEEAQSNLDGLTKDVQKAIRRAKRAQGKADLAGINMDEEILLKNDDAEEVIEAKKQVHAFKLYVFETISRKNEALQKFIDNAVTMVECAPEKEVAMAEIEKFAVPFEELTPLLKPLKESIPPTARPTIPTPTPTARPTVGPTIPTPTPTAHPTVGPTMLSTSYIAESQLGKIPPETTSLGVGTEPTADAARADTVRQKRPLDESQEESSKLHKADEESRQDMDEQENLTLEAEISDLEKELSDKLNANEEERVKELINELETKYLEQKHPSPGMNKPESVQIANLIEFVEYELQKTKGMNAEDIDDETKQNKIVKLTVLLQLLRKRQSILSPMNGVPGSGGKTLRKRAVNNKTRNKLNRKSRRNRYK